MEKPSFLTSTFSIITIIATISYCGLCLYQKDIINLKEIVLMLLGGYATKKGFEMQKPNGEPNVQKPSTETTKPN